MNAKRIAIFAGTFDPVTLGHTEIVERAAVLFDEVVVAVGLNSQKKTLFTEAQRISMLHKAFAGMARVKVETYDGLTAHFAQQRGAGFLLRGIRSGADMEYERPIMEANRHIVPGLETVFFIASEGRGHISSTIVRELIKYRAPLTGYVPESIIPDIYG